VYTTSDWALALTGATAYSGAASDLFTNPASGDFSIKDASFAGKATAGDPRWREGGSTTPPPPPPPAPKIWNFSDAAFTSVLPASITSELSIDGLTLIATSASTMVFTELDEDGKKSIDGYSFTHRLNLNGGGSTTSRAVKFAVTGPCTVTVYSLSSSSGTDRILKVNNGSSTTDIVVPSANNVEGKGTGKSTYTYTGGEGSLYIYSSSGGIYLYLVKVEY
jgi:hypothetical protein